MHDEHGNESEAIVATVEILEARPPKEAAAELLAIATRMDAERIVEIRPDLAELGAHLERASLADGTLRAYRSKWKRFEAWAAEHGIRPLPASPEVVAAYVAALAADGRASTTVDGALSAIRWAHLEAHARTGLDVEEPT
ncbi:MAG: site-specific integrase, partial [Polyangiaceae bacterium]|nr:site-specific integrase [Polyangiaceae bacterium]